MGAMADIASSSPQPVETTLVTSRPAWLDALKHADPQLTLNAEIVNVVLAGISEGMSRTGAFALAGVAKTTASLWLEKGREGLEPYYSILCAIQQAEGKLEQVVLGPWMRSLEWQAKEKLLARRFRDEWGSDKQDSNGPAIVVNIGLGFPPSNE